MVYVALHALCSMPLLHTLCYMLISTRCGLCHSIDPTACVCPRPAHLAVNDACSPCCKQCLRGVQQCLLTVLLTRPAHHAAARCGAVLMTCAVVYLRYHYFVDALFAIVLVKVGICRGMCRGMCRRIHVGSKKKPRFNRSQCSPTQFLAYFLGRAQGWAAERL